MTKSTAPLIGLSGGNAPVDDCDPTSPKLARDTVLRHYPEALIRAGGLPFLMPLSQELLAVGLDDDEYIDPCGPGALRHNAGLYMDAVAGLVLTGGGDVSLKESSRSPHSQGSDRSRDYWEAGLLSAALERGKPVLGICRGLQLLNVALGGTLWHDIPTEYPGALSHRQGCARFKSAHSVRLEEKSRLANICGAVEFEVNSIHHQAVREPSPCLEVVGRSPDGLVEAVEHRDFPFVIGVQWHPEAMLRSRECAAIFEAFVKACQA